MEAGQEAVFTSVGEELDAACRSLAGDGHDKLEVRSFFSFSDRDFARVVHPCRYQLPKKIPPGKKEMPHVPKSYIIHLPPAKRNVLFLRRLRGWLGAILRLKLCQAAPSPRLISLLSVIDA